MLIKKGISVSPGVAIAKAVVVDAQDKPVPRRTVLPGLVPQELQRLDSALSQSAQDIEQLRTQAEAKVGSDLSKIFGAHQSMLADKQLTDQFKKLIDEDRVTAEFAVYSVMRDWAQKFERLESRYFRDRAEDIMDLERRVLGHLIGETHAELHHLRSDTVVVAHDLTPSQTAAMDRNKIKAIATDAGGRTSHTAILAHALGIPALVGLEDLTSQLSTGDTIIVDANNGLVIVNPDAAQLMEYRQYQARIAILAETLDETAKLPAVTLDGTAVTVLANIEFPHEIAAALAKGAAGVGLFRTEFLFLAAEKEPTEEVQYQTYQQAIKALAGRPLTIRTLDLGADKLAQCLAQETDQPAEANPFLGCRSIRLCLQNLPLFKTQLRAILRASTDGPVRIMFPLISSIMELRQAKMVLSDVIEDLEDEGLAYDHGIPVGIMIEVPSAALQAKALAHEVGFFSIGTNDLIQYTVAVDRGNERIASLYTGAHPAIIQLLRDVVRAAQRAKIDVSLCGEMAGDPAFVALLLGLGLRSFSVAPPAVPEVKRIVRSVTIHQCQRLARKVVGYDTDREVLNYLQDHLQRIVPDVIQGRNPEP